MAQIEQAKESLDDMTALAARSPRSPVQRIAPFSLVIVLVLEYLVFVAIRPRLFLTTETVGTILSSQAPLLFATLALTLTLIVNEFDLTVGANLVFTEVLVAALTVKYHVPVGAAALVALSGGILVGVLTSYLVVGLRIRSFVVTLGMSTLLSGVSLAVADSTFIPGVPHPLVAVASTSLFGVSLSVYYAFALAVVLWYVYEYTPLGRYLYYTGANAEVARLSGIPTAA